jgi:hypothetical protein
MRRDDAVRVPFVEREAQSAMKTGTLRIDAVRRFEDDPNLRQKSIAQWDVSALRFLLGRHQASGGTRQ